MLFLFTKNLPTATAVAEKKSTKSFHHQPPSMVGANATKSSQPSAMLRVLFWCTHVCWCWFVFFFPKQNVCIICVSVCVFVWRDVSGLSSYYFSFYPHRGSLPCAQFLLSRNPRWIPKTLFRRFTNFSRFLPPLYPLQQWGAGERMQHDAVQKKRKHKNTYAPRSREQTFSGNKFSLGTRTFPFLCA